MDPFVDSSQIGNQFQFAPIDEADAGGAFDVFFGEFTAGGDFDTGTRPVLDEEADLKPPTEFDRLLLTASAMNNRRLPIYNFKSNLRILRRRLGLLSDIKWVQWLQCKKFRPAWNLLWCEWLRSNHTEMLNPWRHRCFRKCIEKYKDYISKDGDRNAQTGIEHVARFLALTVFWNFGRRALENAARNTEPLELMWAVLLVIKLAHSPENINRPRGGLALMNRPYRELLDAGQRQGELGIGKN